MTGRASMTELAGRAHDLLSTRVLLPFSYARGLAHPDRRAHVKAFLEGMRFRRLTADWSNDHKRAWVLDRLRLAVRRAVDAPYYREHFAEIGFDPRSDFDFDDFAALPPLDRATVQAQGKALVSTALPARALQRDATGGSTGVPTEVWLGPEERGWRASGADTFLERLGAPRGTRLAMLWGHHLDPVGSDRLRDRLYALTGNHRWFDCFRLSDDALARYHRDLDRWRPGCITAYGSALASLAHWLGERDITPSYPTRCLVTGAEKLLPEQRETIESVFGKPVHEQYGSRDVGGMAFEYGVGSARTLEVDWPCVMLEPESAEPESPILVTKLRADGMPMLRYRVGDRARFGPGSVPGAPALSLAEVAGRATDRIWLRDGSWVNGMQIPHLMKEYKVREFQLVQARDYDVELRIVPREGLTNEDLAAIHAVVASNLPGLRLDVVLTGEIARTLSNKLRPVMSDVVRKEALL